MQNLLHKLIFSLFKKDSLQQCRVEELEQLAEQYPYFSTAQLLLSLKMKQIEESRYGQQLQKASLYFDNPLWLHHLVSEAGVKAEEKIAEETPQPVLSYEDFHNDELVIENQKHHMLHTRHSKNQETTMADSVRPAGEKMEPAGTGLIFEPYYTVDYFASQGIKPVTEEKPTDRFGQQLKSFTEWLKTIRQMPPEQIASLNDSTAEQKVAELAVHSLDDRHVETEAMAEVWAKQGHPEKAAEIYRKLSLLNPSKSSYFAGLIENLKS
jgi:hypothetical protein